MQTESEREQRHEQRQQHDEGQEHEGPPVAEGQQGDQQQTHLDEVGHQVGPDRGAGQHLPREVGLLDQRLVAGEAADAAHHAELEEVPGQQGAQQEQRIYVETTWFARSGLMCRKYLKTMV